MAFWTLLSEVSGTLVCTHVNLVTSYMQGFILYFLQNFAFFFRNKQDISGRRRFLMYSAYSWTLGALLTTVVLVLPYIKDDNVEDPLKENDYNMCKLKCKCLPLWKKRTLSNITALPHRIVMSQSTLTLQHQENSVRTFYTRANRNRLMGTLTISTTNQL